MNTRHPVQIVLPISMITIARNYTALAVREIGGDMSSANLADDIRQFSMRAVALP